MIAGSGEHPYESFRALADLIPQLVYLYDRFGKPLYFNRRFLEFTGLTQTQALAGDRFQLVHPLDRESVHAAWERALLAGEPFECELRMRGASGAYRWFLSRAGAVQGADGKVERWYGTLTDIEDQKRTEETLRVISDVGNRFSATLGVEATLQLLADTAVEAFADWCSIYTYDAGGSLTIAALAHKDPDSIALVRQIAQRYPAQPGDAAQQVAASGKPVLYPDITIDMLEAAATDAEHYRMIAELGLRSAMIVPLRARGESLGVMSLVSAESNRRYSESDVKLALALAQRASLAYDAARLIGELTRSQNELRQLVETIPQMVWVNDPVSGSIQFANQRWLSYFGLTQEQNQLWSMRDYAHPDDVAAAHARWRECLKAAEPYEAEYRLKSRDGTYHWFLGRGLPVRDDAGRVVKWFGSATNIDAQKQEFERTQHVADTLQQAFIPRTLPQNARVRFDALYSPAETLARVGGDWYDAFEVDGTIVFSIGDVAGHGLEAAVAMANIRQAIWSAGVDSREPAEVLRKVNRLLCMQQSFMATALIGFVREGHVVYSTAGHPPGIVARDSKSGFLAHSGMPLGVDADAHYDNHRIEVPPGTLLVFYTDGLTEARHRIEEDEQLLLHVCAQGAGSGMTAAEIRSAVLGDSPSPDDTAIMTLRF